jgi:hypothetical protein
MHLEVFENTHFNGSLKVCFRCYFCRRFVDFFSLALVVRMERYRDITKVATIFALKN